ncbi:MAG: hypothetical protein F4164_06390 [Gemmatimonadales bacterium]|nr:hypothetical protein [Gemmatimonadales bacterium]MYG48989.1 hypothetical protein [Gemmatimonadales bacterium]MYK01851.1 hypothetical protein [Candidatus Palauibacter ramosifaciens]
MQRFTLLLTLTVASAPMPGGAAQQREGVQERPPYDLNSPPGMVFEDGQWRAPTPASALEIVLSEDATFLDYEPGAAVLRQTFGRRPAGELNAFADQLEQVIVQGEPLAERLATSVLLVAVTSHERDPGIPYEGALSRLIRAYETLDETNTAKARRILAAIQIAGGEDYIWGIFRTSEKPEACETDGHWKPCQTAARWCDAGVLLLRATGGPEPADFMLRCDLAAPDA